MKLKVCHIINDFNRGGAERLLIEALPFYIDAGIDVQVLQLSSKNSHPDFLTMLKDRGVIYHDLGIGSLYNPLLIFKAKKFLNDVQFDIVHVHLFPAMYWVSIAARLMKNKPVLIFTEHSTQNRRFNKLFLRPLDRFIYKKYDKIIAISEAVNNKLQNWTLMNKKIVLVRNGVNISRFKNAEIYPQAFFEQEFSIPNNTIKVLMVARFFYPKDHITLIKALQLLPANFHVLFAGSGEDKIKVEHFAIENALTDRVHFLGFRNDIPDLMKSVDINVLSSKYEGMSGVTLEALATGKPFVGSDVPGINDTVPDDRYLFEAGNHVSLHQKLKKIIDNTDLKLSMINDGINYVKSFDMRIMVNEYVKIYKQAYERNHSRYNFIKKTE